MYDDRNKTSVHYPFQSFRGSQVTQLQIVTNKVGILPTPTIKVKQTLLVSLSWQLVLLISHTQKTLSRFFPPFIRTDSSSPTRIATRYDNTGIFQYRLSQPL